MFFPYPKTIAIAIALPVVTPAPCDPVKPAPCDPVKPTSPLKVLP